VRLTRDREKSGEAIGVVTEDSRSFAIEDEDGRKVRIKN
jgi:hypothetical protein